MLTPNDLQGIANDLTDIYADVEAECIASIVSHIVRGKSITQASLWQMKKLDDVGALKRDLIRRIKAQTKASLPRIESLIDKALRRSVGIDISKTKASLKVNSGMSREALFESIVNGEEFQRILSNALAGCKSAINLTSTKALQASVSAYTKAVNKAYLQLASGNYTLQQAVRGAVSDIGKSGIRIVDDAKVARGTDMVSTSQGNVSTTYATSSGLRTYPLDSAIRRDLVTQINQACGEITLNDCSELDTQLVVTSWHMGARPEHERWQGKVFSLTPNNKKYPYFYDPQEKGGTGYNTVTGLCGINCYHSFNPYWEGDDINNEGKPTKAENDKAYKEQQTQRYYERSLRNLKRNQVALRESGDIETARKVQSRINDMNSRYRGFLEDTGRTRVSMLDQVSGYRPIKASE